jgi:hypothetical protein
MCLIIGGIHPLLPLHPLGPLGCGNGCFVYEITFPDPDAEDEHPAGVTGRVYLRFHQNVPGGAFELAGDY